MSEPLLAWLAHAYTALGLVCAAAIFVLIVRGGDEAFRAAFAADDRSPRSSTRPTGGWRARSRVKTVLPGFDGRQLDDLIDFLTYTCLPLAAALAGRRAARRRWQAWLLVPLVASAYGFCQVDAKTDGPLLPRLPVLLEHRRALPLPAAAAGALGRWRCCSSLAVLTFVPARYLYPSRAGGRWSLLTNVLGVRVGCSCCLAILWSVERGAALAGASPRSRFPAYYMVAVVGDLDPAAGGARRSRSCLARRPMSAGRSSRFCSGRLILLPMPETTTVAERTLPHNLEAERSVLGAILIQNDAYNRAVELLRPEDFYRDAHRRIFEQDHRARRAPDRRSTSSR